MLRIMEEERDFYKTEYEALRKKKASGKSPTGKEKVQKYLSKSFVFLMCENQSKRRTQAALCYCPRYM